MHKLYAVDLSSESLDDLSIRARRVLGQAALIVLGEAGSTDDVLGERDPVTPVLALCDGDPAVATTQILDALQSGDVVWVSDVARRTAAEEGLLADLLERGVPCYSLPGGSGVVDSVVLSGLPAHHFTFLGTMPMTGMARRDALRAVAGDRYALVSTVRGLDLVETLRDVETVLGNRCIALCGGGEVWRGPVIDAPDRQHDVYLVIAGAESEEAWTEAQVRQEVCAMVGQGESVRDIARAVAQRARWRRRAVYRVVLEVTAGPQEVS